MKRIAFVLPHFGRLNHTGYFPLFLAGCAANPTVDFLFFTDDPTPFSWPANTHVTRLSFDALRERIQALYPFPIVLDNPLQLCNFKPAYGEIFAAELAGFDFWGHLDSDLILGDVRRFVTDRVLAEHDKVYTHGHMTLYRNDPEVNTLYRAPDPPPGRNTDYRRCFSRGLIDNFDEWGVDGGINAIFLRRGVRIYDRYDFDDIAVDRAAFTPALKRDNPPYHSMRHCCYEYRQGTLYRHALLYGGIHTAPVLYAHFQKRPMACRPEELEPGRYLIVPDAFLPWQAVDEAFLASTRKDGLRWAWLRWRAGNFAARRLYRLRHPGQ